MRHVSTSETNRPADTARAQQDATQALLRRALVADRAAWCEFFHDFNPLVERCAARVLARSRRRGCAETQKDAVSEVWLTLLKDDMRRLRMFDPSRGTSLRGWIARIATNATIDFLRVHCRDERYCVVAMATCADESAPPPDRVCQQRREVEAAIGAIKRLSLRDQRFISYCYFKEWCPSRVAAELGLSVNTVYARKFKLRSKLARLVAAAS